MYKENGLLKSIVTSSVFGFVVNHNLENNSFELWIWPKNADMEPVTIPMNTQNQTEANKIMFAINYYIAMTFAKNGHCVMLDIALKHWQNLYKDAISTIPHGKERKVYEKYLEGE
jgi:hypothetical protein